MRKHSIIALGVVLVFFSSDSHAIQLTASTGALQLPNSAYHLLTFDLQTQFAISETSALLFQFGSIPPFNAHGFRELVSYASVDWEWLTARSGFALLGGVGVGAYVDMVNGNFSPLPSLVLLGGMRVGSEHFGIQLSMMTYLGIKPFWQFISYSVAWPMYNFLGGIYVGL